MSPDPTPQDIQVALKTLRWLAENPQSVDDPLGQATARAYKRVRKHRRRILAAWQRPVRSPSDTLSCYVCQRTFAPHAGDYSLLCPECAADHALHRHRRTQLSARAALITGARVKVGYQTALKLLRDGARVIATTRFPADAAARYAAEPDFAAWRDRLTLYALDLRDPRAIHTFVAHLEQDPGHLNILINNAAQTLRRPPEFYHALRAQEARARAALPPAAQSLLSSAPESPLVKTPQEATPETLDFPHTWQLAIEEVATTELAEVMLINAMAPFILCSQLEPLIRRSPFPDRHIINVTSAEGQFQRASKSPLHPHTNMAKAALNMLTRTAAERCAAAGIYMNSVDPGWVTHMIAQDPHTHAENTRFTPPLDAIDAAARIYDPIIRGTQGQPVWGLLLKDYQSVSW